MQDSLYRGELLHVNCATDEVEAHTTRIFYRRRKPIQLLRDQPAGKFGQLTYHISEG